jgi:hypothetical protein
MYVHILSMDMYTHLEATECFHVVMVIENTQQKTRKNHRMSDFLKNKKNLQRERRKPLHASNSVFFFLAFVLFFIAQIMRPPQFNFFLAFRQKLRNFWKTVAQSESFLLKS